MWKKIVRFFRKFDESKFEYMRSYYGLKTKLVEHVSEIQCSISLPEEYCEISDISDILVRKLEMFDKINKKDKSSTIFEYLFDEAFKSVLDSSVLSFLNYEVLYDNLTVILENKRLGGADYEGQICELLASAARKNKTKKMPFFGVITDGITFQFFAIDTDLQVYSSGDHTKLRLKSRCDYKNSEDLKQIISWMKFIIASSISVSPQSYSLILDNNKVESLRKLRSHFTIL